MPMGDRYGGTNCQTCIDCEPMTDGITRSYRCYGQNKPSGAVPIKRNFAEGQDEPPKRAPSWCPHRKCNRGGN